MANGTISDRPALFRAAANVMRRGSGTRCVPRMLNYIVAIYLIVAGILGLFGDIRLR
jgi:hypothetical protein